MLSFPVTKLESTIRDYIVHLRHDRKLSPGIGDDGNDCTYPNFMHISKQ